MELRLGVNPLRSGLRSGLLRRADSRADAARGRTDGDRPDAGKVLEDREAAGKLQGSRFSFRLPKLRPSMSSEPGKVEEQAVTAAVAAPEDATPPLVEAQEHGGTPEGRPSGRSTFEALRLSALTRSLNSLQALQVPAYFRRNGRAAAGKENRGMEGQEKGRVGSGEEKEEMRERDEEKGGWSLDIERSSEEKEGVVEEEEWKELVIREDSSDGSTGEGTHMGSVGEGARLYGSILKHPGKVRTRPLIKHVEFLDNLEDHQETHARHF